MGKQLGGIRATFGAFFGKDIGYYPRSSGKETKISAAQIIAAINTELTQLNDDDAKCYLDEIKESYKEVKLATEYQDQKTARLLTILAFLTAAAGTVFSKVLDLYSFRLPSLSQEWTIEVVIPIVYALFGLYMLLVSVGALISFHAMQTRFITPEDSVSSNLKSLLFFKFISTTEPAVWGKQFSQSSASKLVAEYVKHYAIETYLIAVKASDKVRYLEPAQRILQWAIRVLVLWIISLAVAVSFVPRDTGKTEAHSMEKIIAPPSSVTGDTRAGAKDREAENASKDANAKTPPEKK